MINLNKIFLILFYLRFVVNLGKSFEYNGEKKKK